MLVGSPLFALSFLAPPMASPSVLRQSYVRRHSQPLANADAADQLFHRAKDVLSSDESVSAVDIVNVIGRWQNWQDWDGIGELKEME